MDEKFIEIANHFSDEERRVLRGYWKELFDYKDKNTAEREIEQKLKEGAKKLLEFEENAKDRLEALKIDHECSFCHKPASKVEKMFQKNEYLYICSQCVTDCYNELHNDNANPNK